MYLEIKKFSQKIKLMILAVAKMNEELIDLWLSNPIFASGGNSPHLCYWWYKFNSENLKSTEVGEEKVN